MSSHPIQHAIDTTDSQNDSPCNVVSFEQVRRQRRSANDDMEPFMGPALLDTSDLGMGQQWPKQGALAAHELAAHELAAHELAAHELAAHKNDPDNALVHALVRSMALAEARTEAAQQEARALRNELAKTRAKMHQMAGLLARWDRHVDEVVHNARATQRAQGEHIAKLTASLAAERGRADAATVLAEQLMSTHWQRASKRAVQR